ncbi:MAG TPA: O-antigen ligase family protein [Pseudorhodoplanes sp.]|nr:O-antigen ligase family protein [Pseudorhodoplanes sp.]
MMAAVLQMVRSGRLLSVGIWSVAILFVGLITGAAAVIMPPMVSIGVVAMIGILLLWALPEMRAVPAQLLRRMFFLMVLVQLCVPGYYAIETGVLPWISIRRLVAATVILLFCITVAGSKAARNKIVDTIRASRLLAVLSLGFLLLLFLSILTSKNPSQALNGFVDAVLVWYVPLFACIFVVRTEKDIVLVLKIIATAGMINASLGAVEFLLERRYYFDIFPKDMLDSMLASNPALEQMYTISTFRHGIYRASSIYSVPLSFGEFAAMAAPVGAYFFFHGERMRWRAFGVMTILASMGSLLISGARGGYVAFLAAMPAMLFLWTLRYSRANRNSILSALFAVFGMIGAGCVAVLILFSGKLSRTIFGGHETAASTSARFDQFNMALPHIMGNPVTGHGRNTAPDLVGFFTPGNIIPTIDSYLITLLVEQGVTGFVLFFGTIAWGVWIGAWLYIRNLDERATLGAPIACSMIAFAVYRPVLSQTENHTLLFLMVGLMFALARASRDWKSEPKYSPPRFPNPGGWQQHQRPGPAAGRIASDPYSRPLR